MESTITTTTTTLSTTTTGKFCEEFKIGQRQVCLKSMGRKAVSEASPLCSLIQGKLPLPTNQKENDDYLNAFRTRVANFAILDYLFYVITLQISRTLIEHRQNKISLDSKAESF